LKALASALGRLVTKIDRAEEIAGAVTRLRARLAASRDVKRLTQFARVAELEIGCDPLQSFLVERYFDGEPLETDGLVVERRAHSFGVIDQTLTAPPRFYVESYRLPAERSPRSLESIERISQAALAASGLSSTGFSIEMRARADDVRVIEVNARLGEDDGFGELFAQAIGFEPMRAAIDVALGAASPPPVRCSAHASLAYQFCFVPGRVSELPTKSEIAELAERGIRAGVTVRVGDEWHVAPHPDAFPHVAWALASHPSSSTRAHELALATARSLRVVVEPRVLQS
jgi:hypothetical protein